MPYCAFGCAQQQKAWMKVFGHPEHQGRLYSLCNKPRVFIPWRLNLARGLGLELVRSAGIAW